MAKNRGRPRGPAQGRPTDQAILAALTAAGGNVSKAAIALGHNRRSVSRWAAEIRDGKREPEPKRTAVSIVGPEPPDWNDPKAVTAWRLARWAELAAGGGQAAIAAIDKISATTGADKMQHDDLPGAYSRADAVRLRAFARRQSFWIGRLVQARIRRHEDHPSDDPVERERDERLRTAWIPVARLESTDLEPLIAVLREYGDPCLI